MTSARDLYPPVEPSWTGWMSRPGGHRLYVEVCGSAAGRPAVVLHGGPGAGCSPDHRRFFDPERYRIILFDQRGAGRSKPLASTSRNETSDLVGDLEAIRCELGVERWMVFGGSWGSTLALAYAGANPERVSALVVRGVWLGRLEDIAWLMDGLRRIFPEHWLVFASHVPEAERRDLLTAYWRRLMDADPRVHMPAALSWRLWERRCEALIPVIDPQIPANSRTLAVARIEAHYMRNRVFLQPGALLANVDRIRAVPCVIVHGRYDMLAPVEGAFALKEAWPEAAIEIVPDAGHSAFEPGIRSRLISATDRLANLYNWR